MLNDCLQYCNRLIRNLGRGWYCRGVKHRNKPYLSIAQIYFGQYPEGAINKYGNIGPFPNFELFCNTRPVAELENYQKFVSSRLNRNRWTCGLKHHKELQQRSLAKLAPPKPPPQGKQMLNCKNDTGSPSPFLRFVIRVPNPVHMCSSSRMPS